MKRKSRELSIFSMSALDLFASALGAFILISVVMFPYFPNTGTADQRDLDEALGRLRQEEMDNAALQGVLSEIRQDLERRLEAVRAAAQREVDAAHREAEEARRQAEQERQQSEDARMEADEARRQAEGLQEELSEAEDDLQESQDELRRVRFPHLDLVIVLDITGSMRNEIDGLKAELNDLSSVLMSLAPSVAIGIVAFGDENWRDTLTLFPLVAISNSVGNRTRLAGFVTRLQPELGLRGGSNRDPPEAFLEALRTAAAMQWRSQAERRQIVMITDNPAYSGEVGAAVDAASSFRAGGDGRSVSTVFVRTDASLQGTAEFLERVATAGGGADGAGGRVHDRESAAVAAVGQCPESGHMSWAGIRVATITSPTRVGRAVTPRSFSGGPDVSLSPTAAAPMAPSFWRDVNGNRSGKSTWSRRRGFGSATTRLQRSGWLYCKVKAPTAHRFPGVELDRRTQAARARNV